MFQFLTMLVGLRLVSDFIVTQSISIFSGVYECPGGFILLTAHLDIENITMDKVFMLLLIVCHALGLIS